MCDPVSAGMAAVSAAGSGLNAWESNRSQKKQTAARNAATMAELERQKGYQAKSSEVFDKSLGNFMPGAQETALTGAQGSVADAFRSNAPQTFGNVSSGMGPPRVAASENKTVAGAFDRGATRDTQLGNLTGWDQRAFDNNIKLNASGRDLDLNTDFAKTSAGVGALEQDAAYKNAFKPNSGFGDLLQFAGNVGSFHAGKGGSFGSLFKQPLSPAVGNPMWGGGVAGTNAMGWF